MIKKILLLLILFFTTTKCSLYEEEEPIILNEDIKHETIRLKSGIEVEKVDGDYIYQGDLILSEDQLRGLDEFGDLFFYKRDNNYEGDFKPEYGIYDENYSTSNKLIYKNNTLGTSRSVVNPPYNHWAMVRFTFDSNLTSYQKKCISMAMEKMESLTNVRFYNATGEPTKHPRFGFSYRYINFRYHKTMNDSAVGSLGGKQTINISDFYDYIIIHEILHALGMFHEQSRPDRDNYINIHSQNIISNQRYNFEKIKHNYMTISYFDFESIMLYGSYFCAISNKATMTKKDGSTFDASTEMSEADRKFVNMYYLPYKPNPNGNRVLIDDRVYKSDNTLMTDSEKAYLESMLN